MVTFFNDKETEKVIKDYEYLLNKKQSTLDNYLYTACELAKIDKVQVIEIVHNKNRNNKKQESSMNLLD